MPGVLIPGIEMTKQCDQGFHRRPRQIGVLSRIYDSLVCKLNTIYSNAIPLPFGGGIRAARMHRQKLRRGAAEREVNCFPSTCSNPSPEGGGWPPKRSAAKRRRPGGGPIL